MWPYFAALAGISWGCSNMLDKYALEKRVPQFLTFIFIAATINLIFGVGMLSAGEIGLIFEYWPKMLVVGLIDVIALLTYVYAIKLDDVSRVVPLFLVAMILTPIGDALLLGNILSLQQYMGLGLIALFGFLLSLNPVKGLTHSMKVFGLMGASALGYTSIWLLTETIIDDVGAITYTGVIYIMRSLWAPIIAIGYFFKKRSTVSQALEYIKPYLTPITLFVIFLSNAFGAMGMLSFTSALEGEGIPSLVEAMSLVQYIVVFFAPLIMTAFWPHHFHEHVTKKIFFQKLICISAMIGGGLLLLF